MLGIWFEGYVSRCGASLNICPLLNVELWVAYPQIEKSPTKDIYIYQRRKEHYLNEKKVFVHWSNSKANNIPTKFYTRPNHIHHDFLHAYLMKRGEQNHTSGLVYSSLTSLRKDLLPNVDPLLMLIWQRTVGVAESDRKYLAQAAVQDLQS